MTSSKYDTYTSPLAERNASPEMLRLWSPRHKFNTWRRIWLAVAQAQHELGLPVSREQVEELRAVVERGITDAEMHAAEKYERELRHDVMAHVHALGDSCPKAKGIIHLGMTSQDVVCNADLMILEEAIELIESKVTRAVISLGDQANRHRATPTLGFTHYQPAQPVTVGRRLALWAHDLNIARGVIGRAIGSPRRRGLRGATGTQASFDALLGGSSTMIADLEARFLNLTLPSPYQGPHRDDQYLLKYAKQTAARLRNVVETRRAMGNQDEGLTQSIANDAEWWDGASLNALRAQHDTSVIELRSFSLVGQTYPRVIDTFILADLASTASVLHKIATDIRLLCNRK